MEKPRSCRAAARGRVISLALMSLYGFVLGAACVGLVWWLT
jgi:hypothetical protein